VIRGPRDLHRGRERQRGGPIYSINKFSEFIGVELGLAPKREFVPHELFYKCAKLQELWRSESIYFKVQIEQINSISDSTVFLQFLLND
jgi:hypothetical protein